MGGGNSKAETIKNKAADKGDPADPDAFANYKGPATKPTLEEPSASPVKSKASSKPLIDNDEQEPDDQRPSAIAKQVRMSQQSIQSQQSPHHSKSSKQIEAEKEARFQMELRKSQEQHKARQEQEQQERVRLERIRKEKEAESEKIRQLQMLRETQKAQEAAKKAAAATTQRQAAPQVSQGSEVFAEHYSPATGMKKSQGYSDIMSSQGTVGNINSPQKQAKQQQMKASKKQDFGIEGMAVNGKGLQRDDSFQQIEQQQQAYRPKPQPIQFKVINYNEEAAKQRDLSESMFGEPLSKYKHQESGIHIGIGMNNEDYNMDAEKNRNIDMGELNELLGI